jgi:hypothetical protein
VSRHPVLPIDIIEENRVAFILAPRPNEAVTLHGERQVGACKQVEQVLCVHSRENKAVHKVPTSKDIRNGKFLPSCLERVMERKKNYVVAPFGAIGFYSCQDPRMKRV